MKFLAVLSLFAILLLMCTYGANVYNMVESGNDGDSYADISAFIYVIAGTFLVFVAYRTVRFNFRNPLAIIPYGIGLSCLTFGLFLLYIKGIVPQ
jgi:drug/metabolite transporter (DMT)-like permease